MTADPKPAARIVDRHALAKARLAGDECCACGHPPANVHHIIPRSEGGDDVAANLILLCGSGTDRCHGALHGTPYVVNLRFNVVHNRPIVRRDAEWVARRLGAHIASRRPDTIAYVLNKLGDVPGRDYLRRIYFIEEELVT